MKERLDLLYSFKALVNLGIKVDNHLQEQEQLCGTTPQAPQEELRQMAQTRLSPEEWQCHPHQ